MRPRGLLLLIVASAAVGCHAPRQDRCGTALVVPEGFCAQLFADGLGSARHVAVDARGDVYVAQWREGSRTGGVVALRDTNGDGRADLRRSFGPEGGSGLALARDATGREWLFLGAWGAVYRWQLPRDRALAPDGEPRVVVDGIPELEHAARSVAVGPDGALYVNIGAPSNACERDYPRRDFRGAEPCTELAWSGGVWRFPDALAPYAVARRPDVAHRFATGLRHTVALGVDPVGGAVYGAPHGIDHLHAWWPQAGYTAEDAAATPAEALYRLRSGEDYGFPYCMYDSARGRLTLAPAYGGRRDSDASPRCGRQAQAPLALFSAHAAPLALVVYRGSRFPMRYRGGVFVALHGSLFHAPRRPVGYEVVFLARRPDGSLAPPERFAHAAKALPLVASRLRASGLAVGPDGALYVSDDAAGRLWRIHHSVPPRRRADPAQQ